MEACLGGDLWTVLHDCGGELEEEQGRVYLMALFLSTYTPMAVMFSKKLS